MVKIINKLDHNAFGGKNEEEKSVNKLQNGNPRCFQQVVLIYSYIFLYILDIFTIEGQVHILPFEQWASPLPFMSLAYEWVGTYLLVTLPPQP